MIYVFPSVAGECSIVYDETTLTDENKANGIAVETLPIANPPTGKTGILMGNKTTNAVWWEYVDIALTDEQKIKDKVNEIQGNQMAIGQAVDGLMSIVMGGVL